MPKDLKSSFKSALEKPWYMGCPVGRLPLMPLQRSKKLPILFMFLFWFIYLNQVFVIEPVLDVWYFMLSTTMLSLKLIISFHVMWASKPGYLERDLDLDWIQVLKKVKSKYVCHSCKVVKTASS
jgi:hypothetical protein